MERPAMGKDWRIAALRTDPGGGFFLALPGGWVDYPNTFQNDSLCPAQVDRKIISLPSRRGTDLRSGKRGSQRSKALMLNSKGGKNENVTSSLVLVRTHLCPVGMAGMVIWAAD